MLLFALCFVWQSLSRFFFCLHLPGIALPTLESFYFRWVSCINLIWEPLSSNKGMGKTFHLLSSHFGWPPVILFYVFCISFIFWLLWAIADASFYPSTVIWKGDILFLTPLVCILWPPTKVLICLCVWFVSSSAYLSLALSVSGRWHRLQNGWKALCWFLCLLTLGREFLHSWAGASLQRRCPMLPVRWRDHPGSSQ